MATIDARLAPARSLAGTRLIRPALRSRSAVLGVGFAIFVLVVLLLPLWLGDPDKLALAVRLRGPSAQHWFGTDEFGRDVLVRVVYGARVSWAVGACASVCALVAGGLYGATAAMLGPRTDAVLMRALEVILAFPGPLLALVLAVAIGPGMQTVIIAISIVYAAPVARLIRGLVLDERKQDYVSAAVLVGSSRLRILVRHIAVNIAAPTLVFMMTVAADAILVEAGLSYLGAGVSPPTPAWGSMVQEGQNLVFGGVWWLSLFAGLAIAVTVLALNTIADSVVDDLRVGGRRG